MKSLPLRSRQEVGFVKHDLSFSHLTSMNIGTLYPICWEEVEIGSTVHNNIDGFFRSGALSDPSFIDADISVGHYFVPFEMIDPLYTVRCQKFKGENFQSETPAVTIWPKHMTSDPSANPSTPIYPAFAPGSLSDRLGIQVTKASATDEVNGPWAPVNFYPYLAYHAIADEFFTNTRLQNSQYVRNWVIENIAPLGMRPNLDFTAVNSGQDWEDTPLWDFAYAPNKTAYHNFFALRTINYEPDYFTTATREAGGPDVAVPTTTIRNLLDAELRQKVIDMLYQGGYSYNDYTRVIMGQEDINHEAHDPTFLAGGSGPLQVNITTNTGDNLGEQAGNVSGGTGFDNGFTHTFSSPGIYMALAFIRPATYYSTGVDEKFGRKTISGRFNPLLSDLSKSAIYVSELGSDWTQFIKDTSDTQRYHKSIFGYKNRYEEYRTRVNRVSGEFRTTRENWYIPRAFDRTVIDSGFIQMSESNVRYSPWVDQTGETDHFFARFYNDFWIVRRLPATPYPYVW